MDHAAAQVAVRHTRESRAAISIQVCRRALLPTPWSWLSELVHFCVESVPQLGPKVAPPSTQMTCPVTYLERSVVRNSITPTQSSTVPKRRNGSASACELVPMLREAA